MRWDNKGQIVRELGGELERLNAGSVDHYCASVGPRAAFGFERAFAGRAWLDGAHGVSLLASNVLKKKNA